MAIVFHREAGVCVFFGQNRKLNTLILRTLYGDKKKGFPLSRKAGNAYFCASK